MSFAIKHQTPPFPPSKTKELKCHGKCHEKFSFFLFFYAFPSPIYNKSGYTTRLEQVDANWIDKLMLIGKGTLRKKFLMIGQTRKERNIAFEENSRREDEIIARGIESIMFCHL